MEGQAVAWRYEFRDRPKARELDVQECARLVLDYGNPELREAEVACGQEVIGDNEEALELRPPVKLLGEQAVLESVRRSCDNPRQRVGHASSISQLDPEVKDLPFEPLKGRDSRVENDFGCLHGRPRQQPRTEAQQQASGKLRRPKTRRTVQRPPAVMSLHSHRQALLTEQFRSVDAGFAHHPNLDRCRRCQAPGRLCQDRR